MDTSIVALIWDLRAGRLAASPLTHPDVIYQAKFSADGSMLLTACRDGNARVWDWRSGTLQGPPMPHQGEVQDIGFLNEDLWVITKSGDNLIRVWDWRTGKTLVPPRFVQSAAGSQLCLSSDGKRAAIGSTSEEGIHVLDLSLWVESHDERFSRNQLRVTAEVLSGQRIERGSSIVSLTTAEWIARWRSYRKFLSKKPRP